MSNSTNNKVIAVGMSGGVDSSVVACLLKQQGYQIIGLTMAIWDDQFTIHRQGRDACFGPGEIEDLKATREICDFIGIPHYTIDLKAEYRQFVLEYFRHEYLAGRTPNPCIVCNQTIKFGFLLNKAQSMGIDFDNFATGHYARIEALPGGRYRLRKATDIKKDQSYFLSGLKQDQLGKIMLPLGSYSKVQVRQLAQDFKLPVAEKAESQDFIDGGDYAPLFKSQDIVPGDIVDTQGKTLGRHKGIMFYTIGQRKGLGVSAVNPLYVVRIEAAANRIVVGTQDMLYSNGLTITNLNLIEDIDQTRSWELKTRIRQQHRETESQVTFVDADTTRISFKHPQLAVTPGQTAVIYQDDIVVGGGVIQSVFSVST